MKKDIDDIIRKDVSDPRIGFFTVTYVHVSKDLRNSTVGISIMGNRQKKESSFAAIKNASGYIYHKLSQKSLLKHTPTIDFKYDEMPEFRVEEILKEIKEENDKRPEGQD